MKTVVELRNVTKTIGKKTIVDDLSFDVLEGEVFGFLGPNGAGKTTTIRMIVGLIGMTKGEIKICGRNITKDFEEAVRTVGAIVENPEMYKFMSGYANLLQIARMTKGVTREKINEVIELVGLKDRIHDKVKTYSLGMRQRLGVAQSLLSDPKVLILDEPTNGLDPAGIREFRDYLRTLTRERGISVIVSSHLLSEMELMCDRIAIIQHGKLVNIQHVRSSMNTEQPTYLYEVDLPDKSKELLLANDWQPLEHSSGVALQLERAQIPKVTKLLLDHQIQVYEIKAIEKSLEDRFLELTSEKGAAVHA